MNLWSATPGDQVLNSLSDLPDIDELIRRWAMVVYSFSFIVAIDGWFTNGTRVPCFAVQHYPLHPMVRGQMENALANFCNRSSESAHPSTSIDFSRWSLWSGGHPGAVSVIFELPCEHMP